jgi:hypothetical protein
MLRLLLRVYEAMASVFWCIFVFGRLVEAYEVSGVF